MRKGTVRTIRWEMVQEERWDRNGVARSDMVRRLQCGVAMLCDIYCVYDTISTVLYVRMVQNCAIRCGKYGTISCDKIRQVRCDMIRQVQRYTVRHGTFSKVRYRVRYCKIRY